MSDPGASVIEGLFVSAGRRCNHNCTFCRLPDRESVSPTALLGRAADQAREWGYGRVVLTGGEPTLRRDLPELATAIRARGLSFGLVTNGRMLLYRGLLSSLLARGLDSVLLWLHGPDATVHDALVRTPGAFDQTAKILRVLAALPCIRIEVRTVLAGGNLALLPRMVEWLSTLKGRAAMYMVLAYGPPAPDSRCDDALHPRKALDAMRAAFEAGLLAGVPVFHEGLPECLAGDLAGADIGRFARERTDLAPADECLTPVPDPPARVLACAECLRTRICPGLPGGLVRIFPRLDAVPIRGVRSNSFDFVEVGRIEGFVPGPGDCAGPALDLPGERYRHVLLWRDDGVVDFRTDTGDFSGDEIREIKEVRQQLLVDTGTQVAMADFQRDVRQVRLCEVCRDCPSRKDCASAWRIDPGTPFRDEEDWLRGELGRIRGRVLDVGCGDLLYQDVVRDLVEAGRITYEGLDPDCGALDRLRASRIDMKIHAMDIEDFDGESGAFDHVLMLRSINHFKDLARAFRIAARLLRAGGTLVVADCIPFALLRSRAKAETAHASAAPLFEHYRNFTSEQFLEFLDRERLPFAVSGHRPIGPGTGNLWLVRLERTDRASP